MIQNVLDWRGFKVMLFSVRHNTDIVFNLKCDIEKSYPSVYVESSKILGNVLTGFEVNSSFV